MGREQARPPALQARANIFPDISAASVSRITATETASAGPKSSRATSENTLANPGFTPGSGRGKSDSTAPTMRARAERSATKTIFFVSNLPSVGDRVKAHGLFVFRFAACSAQFKRKLVRHADYNPPVGGERGLSETVAAATVGRDHANPFSAN